MLGADEFVKFFDNAGCGTYVFARNCVIFISRKKEIVQGYCISFGLEFLNASRTKNIFLFDFSFGSLMRQTVGLFSWNFVTCQVPMSLEVVKFFDNVGCGTSVLRNLRFQREGNYSRLLYLIWSRNFQCFEDKHIYLSALARVYSTQCFESSKAGR